MTGACAKRANGHLACMFGLLAMLAASLLAAPAFAEQPVKLLRLRDSDRSARRADNFDLPSGRDAAISADRHTLIQQQSAIIGEVVARPAPRWLDGQPRDDARVHAPAAIERRELRDSPTNRLAWGLTGTGASIFTGALLYHFQTMAQQNQYDSLTARAGRQQYRDLRNQIDQTRKFVLALYAVGGSMLTGGVVLMATDDINGEGVQAKLAPAWMNGGPAARLQVSF